MDDRVHRVGDRRVDAELLRRAAWRPWWSSRPRRPGVISARMSAIFWPCPSARPTRRLRDASPEQVSTRSPIPDRPANVCALRAERDADARDLGEPARDQRDPRVRAEPEAVGDTGGDRDHVLERAADQHAEHVVGRVDAEVQPRSARAAPRASSRRRGRRARSRRASRRRSRSANVGPERKVARSAIRAGRTSR